MKIKIIGSFIVTVIAVSAVFNLSIAFDSDMVYNLTLESLEAKAWNNNEGNLINHSTLVIKTCSNGNIYEECDLEWDAFCPGSTTETCVEDSGTGNVENDTCAKFGHNIQSSFCFEYCMRQGCNYKKSLCD